MQKHPKMTGRRRPTFKKAGSGVNYICDKKYPGATTAAKNARLTMVKTLRNLLPSPGYSLT